MSLEPPKLSLPVDPSRDHIQGADTAPITLLEYGDYECPFCGQAYLIIKQIQNSFGEDLRFAFRNFPITQSHPHELSHPYLIQVTSAFTVIDVYNAVCIFFL